LNHRVHVYCAKNFLLFNQEVRDELGDVLAYYEAIEAYMKNTTWLPWRVVNIVPIYEKENRSELGITDRSVRYSHYAM